MKNRKLRKVCPLAFDNLEFRLPPAGQVLITLAANGTLRIEGDAAANDISIVQTASGELTVTGNDGETFLFNGNAINSGDAVAGVTKHVKIALQGGDDTMEFIGLGPDIDVPAAAVNLEINAGEGADDVHVVNSRITGKVKIDAGEADDDAADFDHVLLDTVSVLKSVTVKTGQGDDDVELIGSLFLGRVTIQTGQGADDAALSNSAVLGRVQVETGDGEDVIEFLGTGILSGNVNIDAGNAAGGTDEVSIDAAGLLIDRLKINTGNGNDDVFLAAVALSRTTIDTGTGHDLVDVNEFAEISGLLRIDLGDGNDQLFFDESFASRVRIKAGAGNDTVSAENFAALDRGLVDLGDGDDTVNILDLTFFGPQLSRILGGAGTDLINGIDNVTGLQFVVDPLTTGVETLNV